MITPATTPAPARGSLLSATLALLKEHGQYESLARATGLSLYWIQKLSNGTIKDPSVNKIQALYEHLTGKPLFSQGD